MVVAANKIIIEIVSERLFLRNQPPAIAPMMKNGSLPEATGSGSVASGEAKDKSSSQAKNRKNGRRSSVTWSRIVPRSIG